MKQESFQTALRAARRDILAPRDAVPGAALARINSHKAIGGTGSQFDFGPLFAQLDR